MRHFYFRLVLGVIWLIAAFVTAVNANFPIMALYLLLGTAFLYSAYSLWKKEKRNRGK